MNILNLASLKARPQDHLPKASEHPKPGQMLVLVADVVHDTVSLEFDGRAASVATEKGFLKAMLAKEEPFERYVNTFLYLVGQGIEQITSPELYDALSKAKAPSNGTPSNVEDKETSPEEPTVPAAKAGKGTRRKGRAA